MRTSIILAALILAAALHLSAQNPKRYEVVGPVRSFRQETAKLTEVDGKTAEGPRVLIQTVTFDDHGNPIDQVMNNPDGTLKWMTTWNGQVHYDRQGRETERVTFDTKGEITHRTVSIYDANGNMIKAVTYGAVREINFYDTFQYDGNGHKIRADYFTADGSTRGNDVFIYDSRGNLIEIIHSAGTLQHRDAFKYDDHGNRTEWSAYDRDGNRGLKVSWDYSDDSKGIPTEFLKYDSNDKVLSKEVYTYEFDARGNWIKSKTTRELYVGELPVIETEVTYRKIDYRNP